MAVQTRMCCWSSTMCWIQGWAMCESTRWKDRTNPLQTKGMYTFSVAIFSNLGAAGHDGNARLPILRIEDLRLPLRSIV